MSDEIELTESEIAYIQAKGDDLVREIKLLTREVERKIICAPIYLERLDECEHKMCRCWHEGIVDDIFKPEDKV